MLAETWLVFAGALLGGMAVLFLLGRRNEGQVEKDWELVLTPRGRLVHSSLESRFKGELELMNATYEEAAAFRALGSMENARRLVRAGFAVIEQLAPNLLRLLAAMATFSRMVSAMAPVEPLRPVQFRVGGLRGLAWLHGVLHHLLVTTSERFRLRLYMLGQGVAFAMRFLLRSTRRIEAAEGGSDVEWDEIAAARGDLGTLTDESLSSLRVLLTSMATERRDIDGPNT